MPTCGSSPEGIEIFAPKRDGKAVLEALLEHSFEAKRSTEVVKSLISSSPATQSVLLVGDLKLDLAEGAEALQGMHCGVVPGS